MSIREQTAMYWKFFFEKAEKYPLDPLPQERLLASELLDKSSSGLKSSWLGHSTLLLNIDGHTVLTDPVLEKKVSPIGPTRFNKELPLSVDELDRIDVVIISHDHYDHLNKYSIRLLTPKTSVFVVPLGVGKRLEDWNVPKEKVVELDWWQEYNFDNSLTIAATPAQHFSGRTLFDRNQTLWASWVIKTVHHRVFFSGDSGYFDGFKTIGKKYGPFDVTFLECGAYNQKWSKVHMFPEQTVQASLDLGGKVVQPIHWSTFNLAFHPWYEPIERFTREAKKQGVTFSTPLMGQTVDYSQPLIANQWWKPAMEKSRKEAHRPLMAATLRPKVSVERN